MADQYLLGCALRGERSRIVRQHVVGVVRVVAGTLCIHRLSDRPRRASQSRPLRTEVTDVGRHHDRRRARHRLLVPADRLAYRSTAWSPSARNSSVFVGFIVGAILTSVVYQKAAEPTAQEQAERQAEVEPLSASDVDKHSFEQIWFPQAQLGDAYSQFVVGEALQNGAMGQSKNLKAAADWINRSAQQGDADGELSLLIARLEGRLGTRQTFDVPDEVAAFAIRQPRWRRVALELWLARHPVVVVGADAPDVLATARWRNRWLEKAARDGSRYAAFQLARELEHARAADSTFAPDIAGALYWYAAADSHKDVDRLQRSSGQHLPDTQLPVIESEETDLALLVRLRQRSELVAQRNRGKVVSPGTDDAMMHFVAYVEASGSYQLLADRHPV